MKKTALILVFLLLSISGRVWAADPVRESDREMFPTNVSYDSRFPTPATFLGHELGSAPVRYHELVEYLQTVASLSDRMTIEVIGYSHERRPILFLVITSPTNHARIGEIREQHVGLTEPSVNQSVSNDMPVVTWLNYGVHGAESAGMDSALPTVYYLAAAQGPEVERILQESVILVTAAFNPDGHAKRASWFDSYSSQEAVSDPQHLEHDYDGQVLRTNHYGFDLNRQWLLLTQPESSAWVRKWHEWRPNVSIDFHEMGSGQTYYSHPGVATRSHPLIPDVAHKLMLDTVRESERFLDSEARLYFHGERFDNFYIGKGSTYPLVNGGVGILYEAGSARGVELDTPHGLRTYRENTRKHFRTSIGSVEGALNQRIKLLEYQKRFYETALTDAKDNVVKAYVFDAPNDAARMYHFVDLLRSHRIKAYELSRNINVNGKVFTAGEAMIVPLRQPQYRMIRGIFDTVTEFKDSTFYDVSSWTVPLAFNLQYEALSGRGFNANLVGAETSLDTPAADAPDAANYGFAFEWAGYYAPRALNRVLGADLLASVATKPFALQTTRGPYEFRAGSIFVPFDRQEQSPEQIEKLMRVIAADDGVFVHAITSGRSASDVAGVNPGGPSFVPVKKPKVLLVTGRGVDLYDTGAAWHLMDFRMRMPVTLRDRDRLDGLDWSTYSHVIFPGGEYEEYAPDYLDTLRQWVEHGGTVVGIRQASQWLRDNVLDYVEPVDGDVVTSPDGSETIPGSAPLQPEEAEDTEDSDETERFNYAEKESRDAVDIIGGAIFSGDVDITHPLGFGYDRRDIAIHKNTDEVMARPDNPYATVIAYGEQPLLSGYASATNKDALAGTAALIADRRGDGSVVLFSDDPNFRAIWYGTNKLFMNALFFSKAFQAQVESSN